MGSKQSNETLSRRSIMHAGMVGAPMLLAAGGAVFAQEQNESSASSGSGSEKKLKDPRELYPKPPFKRQPQDWPGLAKKMEPQPDHGEESYKGSGRLKGRRALITGGDSGIGRATAIAYAREGADVVINYLPVEEPDAEDVVKLLKGEGHKIVTIPGDLREESFCRELVKKAVSELGGLDILVNNAARQTAQPKLEDITTEQWDATFKTNVYAIFWITKAALEHMPAGSVIINTSSIQAYDPSPNLIDYAQTKACNISFTKSLAKQLIERGIRVNAIAPGPFWTPLQPSGGQPQDAVQTFGKSSAYGRPGQPAEIAPLFVLLASDEASYVTGEVFGATGGMAPF